VRREFANVRQGGIAVAAQIVGPFVPQPLGEQDPTDPSDPSNQSDTSNSSHLLWRPQAAFLAPHKFVPVSGGFIENELLMCL
jgi:hypothetical protein